MSFSRCLSFHALALRLLAAIGLTVALGAPAAADTRMALVIANTDYVHVAPLKTPSRDADLIADALRKTGFVVTVQRDGDKIAMETALKAFGQAADRADVALVYYAGHGIEVGGNNYLIPVDAVLKSDRDVDFEAVPLSLVLRAVDAAHRLRLVVLDACRNNPFKVQVRDSRRAISRGLARIEPEGDTLVAYAAKDGTTAADGVDHSPFAKAFAQEILVPGQEVQFVFRKIRDDVLKATDRQQEPFLYGSLSGTAYYFLAPTTVNVVAPANADAKALELALWQSVGNSGDRGQLQSYLDQYPQGTFAGAARAKIAALQPHPVATASQPTPSAVSAAYRDVLVMRGHTNSVSSVAASPDGRWCVSASRDRTARIWDARSGALRSTLSGHGGDVFSAAFSPDGKRIVTASADRTAVVWDVESGVERLVLRGHTAAVHAAVYAPNGRWIATASWDKTVKIWDARQGTLVRTLAGHTDAVVSVSFSPDGTRIATASNDDTVRLWDAQTGVVLAVFKGHGDDVESVAFSSDGRLLVSASDDRTARVWDTQTGQEKFVLRGHADKVWSAAFSPDGTQIVTASWDQTIRLWSAADGRELAILAGHAGKVWSVAFLGNGRVLSASSDRTVRLWQP